MSDSVRAASLRAWLLALAASLLFVLFSARAEAAPPTTVAVGDSITNGAREKIQTKFNDAGWHGSVVAEGGLAIKELRPFLRYIAAFTPSLQRVFFFGGTNDAWNREFARDQETEKQFVAKVKQAVEQLNLAAHDVIDKRPRACMFLVTVKEWGHPGSRYYRTADALNDHMYDLARKYRKVDMVDWNTFSQAHDSPAEGNWFADLYGHLNEAGHEWLANLYGYWGGSISGCGTTLP